MRVNSTQSSVTPSITKFAAAAQAFNRCFHILYNRKDVNIPQTDAPTKIFQKLFGAAEPGVDEKRRYVLHYVDAYQSSHHILYAVIKT